MSPAQKETPSKDLHMLPTNVAEEHSAAEDLDSVEPEEPAEEE